MVVIMLICIVGLTVYGAVLESQSKDLDKRLRYIKSQLGVGDQDSPELLHLRDVFFEHKYLFLHADFIRERLESLDSVIRNQWIRDLTEVFSLFVHENNRESQEFLFCIVEGIFSGGGKQVYTRSIEPSPIEFYQVRMQIDPWKIRSLARKDFFGGNAVARLASLEQLAQYPEISAMTDVFVQKFALAVAHLDGEYSSEDQKNLDNFLRYLYNLRESQIFSHTLGSGGDNAGSIAKQSNLVFADLQSALNGLDALVGIPEIKARVRSLTNFVRIQSLRGEKGLKTQDISLSMVFYGSPGTGKTTVARYLGEIFRHLGILAKGHIVETDREGLVAGYVGQTASKTKALLQSAIDGILFIDEAYALAGKDKSDKDFGKEAIDTILKEMEDSRSRLIVIVAGYEAEMREFIDSNPGLKSRFGQHLIFEDFSADELYEILDRSFVQKNMFRLADSAKASILSHFQSLVDRKVQNFGNARYCRNLFEIMIQAQANRVMGMSAPSKHDFIELTGEDFDQALERMKA